MLIKQVTNNLFDCFSNTIGNESTGFNPNLWVRVFKKKDGKIEFVKGNRSLLKQVVL